MDYAARQRNDAPGMRPRWNYGAIVTLVLGAASGANLRLAGMTIPQTYKDTLRSRRVRHSGNWCASDTRVENHFHVAVYLTHVVFGVSQRTAGRVFGLDRTSVRYACARIEDARDDKALDSALDILAVALIAHVEGLSQAIVQERV